MKNYEIRITDIKGEGGTFEVQHQAEVLATVKRLLEHGTKYIGDKITEITIRRRCAVKRKGGGA